MQKVQINVNIPDDLNKRFRDRIGEVYGFKKGNLEKAATEAFELFIMDNASRYVVPNRMHLMRRSEELGAGKILKLVVRYSEIMDVYAGGKYLNGPTTKF